MKEGRKWVGGRGPKATAAQGSGSAKVSGKRPVREKGDDGPAREKRMRGVRRTVAVLEQDGVARRVDLLRPQRHVIELRARVQLQPVEPAHTMILAAIFGSADCSNSRADHL